MEINNLVVARYTDGRVLKGFTHDFSANRPMFHIEVSGTSEVVELRTRQLKALFFVRTLEGDAHRDDVRGFIEGPPETSQGKKIAVRFRDGEFICGYTLSWTPDREGFFLFPADAGANNQRIWVVTAATNEIKAGPMAERLAERVLAERAAGGAPSGPAGRGSASTQSMPRPTGRPSGLMPKPPAPPKPGDRAA